MTISSTPRAFPAAMPPFVRRSEVLSSLVSHLRRADALWAMQGDRHAQRRWCDDDGPADLDVWVAELPAPVARWLDGLPGARVAEARDPRRLRHLSWAVPVAGHLAVLDLTVGDLRVGPLLLVPAAEVTVRGSSVGPRLTGPAAVADLFLRPVLRGRVPSGERLAEARSAWRALGGAERLVLLGRLTVRTGPPGRRLSTRVAEVLDARTEPTEEQADGLARLAVRALTLATVAPSALPATWSQRRTIVPAGGAAGPAGLRCRGVVVALVGTDGAGKSSVQQALTQELEHLGIPARRAYFGMAHGNLPGVALARRLLRVEVGPRAAAPSGSAPGPGRGSLAHPRLRRMAAWYYAAEYVVRWTRLVAPGLLRREVVVCDRWVTDLRESPWPGSTAARLVQGLLPAPDVVVLPDSPDELIHARKPERSPLEQARQQQSFRDLLSEHPARVAEVVVDTSGSTPAVSVAVGAVLEAMHRAPRAAR